MGCQIPGDEKICESFMISSARYAVKLCNMVSCFMKFDMLQYVHCWYKLIYRKEILLKKL